MSVLLKAKMLHPKLGIKRYFFVQRIAFRALGIDLISAEATLRSPLLFGVLFLSCFLLIWLWSDNTWRFRQDMDKITEPLLPLIQAVLCSWKIQVVLYRRKELKKLIKQLMALTSKATKEELSIIAAENKIDRLFSGIYYLSCSGQVLMIAIAPPIMSAIFYTKMGQFAYFMPIKISTPYDQQQPLYYAITCVWIALATHFAVHCGVSVNTLYSWLVHNIAAQFRILQLRLTHAAAETNASSTEQAIRSFVAYHQQILKLAYSFDVAFRPVIFMEFTLNGLEICFIAYQMTRGSPMQNMPFLVLSIGLELMQFMIYCYGGQRIQDESQRIYSVLYMEFPWHRTSMSAQKLLRLILLRAQKECNMTGIFYIANWPLFIKVVSESFSYFTLLWTLVDKESN